jgi:hypothetical protein
MLVKIRILFRVTDGIRVEDEKRSAREREREEESMMGDNNKGAAVGRGGRRARVLGRRAPWLGVPLSYPPSPTTFI